MTTIKTYKGATIEITETTEEYRSKAAMFNNINYWVNVRGAKTGNVYEWPVMDLALAMRYIRRRILTAKAHPTKGWA